MASGDVSEHQLARVLHVASCASRDKARQVEGSDGRSGRKRRGSDARYRFPRDSAVGGGVGPCGISSVLIDGVLGAGVDTDAGTDLCGPGEGQHIDPQVTGERLADLPARTAEQFEHPGSRPTSATTSASTN